MEAKRIFATSKACLPPHKVTDASKVDRLVDSMLKEGWPSFKSALVGYRDQGKIQLLSGSHRHAAATRLGMAMPVMLHPASSIELAWGDLVAWKKIMGSGDVFRKERS